MASRASHALGDVDRDAYHLDKIDDELAGRPVSPEHVAQALQRVARAVIQVQPERLEPAAAHAIGVAGELGDPATAARVATVVGWSRAVSRVDQGDPAGTGLLDELLARTDGRSGVERRQAIIFQANAYPGAVPAMLHDAASALYERAIAAIERQRLGWSIVVAAFRALELIQRGRYAEGRGLIATVKQADAGHSSNGSSPVRRCC